MSKQQQKIHDKNEETMNIDLDRKGPSLAQRLEYMKRDLKSTEMIPVYWNKKEFGIYCALIPSHQVEGVLAKSSWDLLLGHGVPSVEYYKGGENQVEYLRYGDDNGIEPLVINHYFNESQTNYGKRKNYSEISEEFRFFHRLYHDRETNEYIKIDDEGNEYLVAVVEPDCIQIRLKEIRRFLAVRQMYLSIQFSFRGDSKHSLEELGVSEDETQSITETTKYGDICWWHWRHRFDSNIRMLEGKRLIKPLPKSKSGFAGFAEEPKYVEFIIDVDENGTEITHTCNPTKLWRYDRNRDAPSDLTLVHFRKQVLDKYYGKPSTYLIEDSRVSCPWWGMRIDNHHDDKVIVFLGDLSSLTYTEQKYWRLYNIPPAGSVSETFFKRYVEGSFTVTSDRPEHLFKQRYDHLQQESEKYLGWQLLRPLTLGDEYHLNALRIPSTEEQGDFDDLVLSLAIILIDSLNQKELKKLISLEQEQNLSPDQQERLKRSIGCLEIALNSCGVEDAAEHITFLQKLQSLRSTGSAHLKGSKYKKIAKDFGIESQSLRSVFAGILSKALDVLDYFIFLIRSRQINREIIEENNIERGYAILSQMIGIADFDSTDESANHDEVIYELDSKP